MLYEVITLIASVATASATSFHSVFMALPIHSRFRPDIATLAPGAAKPREHPHRYALIPELMLKNAEWPRQDVRHCDLDHRAISVWRLRWTASIKPVDDRSYNFV